MTYTVGDILGVFGATGIYMYPLNERRVLDLVKHKQLIQPLR